MTSQEIRLLKLRIDMLDQSKEVDGSLFFDDELKEHLSELKEDLKEAIHEKLIK